MLATLLLTATIAATSVTPGPGTVPQSPAGPASTGEGSEGAWYGAPALIVDAAAVGLISTSVVLENKGTWLQPVTALAGAGGLVAGLIVAASSHAHHGENGRMATSVFLRLAAVFGTVAAVAVTFSHSGCGTDSSDPSRCDAPDAAATIGGLTILGVMVVDDLLLARVSPRPASSPGPSLTPAVSFSDSGALFTLRGRF